MDIQSPEFKRMFPKIVLAVCLVGLALVMISTFLVAVGYNQ
jgi:hypothetical protein